MAEIDIIIPSVIGVVIGISVSFLFTRYSVVSNSYNATIFGINSNSLVTGLMLFLIISGIITLVGLSIVVKDTEYITNKPVYFFLELLAMGLLPTAAFLLVFYFRTGVITTMNSIELSVLAIKFAGLHTVLQLSGYYRSLFG
jgi:hypothetical protein